jgi:ATP-dependent DNA helicase RecQ
MQSKGGAADEELFSILKDLRKKVSKKKNVPPFVIFQDPSLEDMATQYPITLDELQNIAGVGTGKAKRYGQDFIDVIKSYVEEKEILRPQDMVVKSVVNKSGMKVYIIQSIDRKMSFDDIASAKGLGMGELLDEVEAIVNSGTKLNIDYYVDQVLDEDHQSEIYDYFMEEAETESIDEAVKELGEDEYSVDDIRIMRIKFLSELGN